MDERHRRLRELTQRTLDALTALIERVSDPQAKARLKEKQALIRERLERENK
jgi:hypothetical protein